MPSPATAADTWRVLYADPSGLSWRTLRDVVPGRKDAVDAFCVERGNVRSFRLDRMLVVVGPDDGPVDPYAFLQAHGRVPADPLDARAWAMRLPVAALLSFAAATCGVRHARRPLLAAVAALQGDDFAAPTALDAWVDRQWHASEVQLLRGDTHAYDLLRAALAPHALDACRVHALAIAGTAGDAPTADRWAARAVHDFAPRAPGD